jgi:hypothetical protein
LALFADGAVKATNRIAKAAASLESRPIPPPMSSRGARSR